MNILTLHDSHFIDDLEFKTSERFALTGENLKGYKLLIKKYPDIVVYLRLEPANNNTQTVNVQFTWYSGNLRHLFRFSERMTDPSLTFSSYEIILPFLEYLLFEFLDFDANRNLGLDAGVIADLMEYVQTARKLDKMFTQMEHEVDASPTLPPQKSSLSAIPGFESVVASFRKLIRNP